jgi:hypothetical protein
VKASIVLIDEIEKHIRYLLQEQNAEYLKLYGAPISFTHTSPRASFRCGGNGTVSIKNGYASPVILRFI